MVADCATETLDLDRLDPRIFSYLGPEGDRSPDHDPVTLEDAIEREMLANVYDWSEGWVIDLEGDEGYESFVAWAAPLIAAKVRAEAENGSAGRSVEN